MKEVPVYYKGNVSYALVDDEDYSRIIQHKWRLTGRAANIPTTTIRVVDRRVSLPLAMIILQLYEATVDHIDRNTMNNQKANLRVCSIGVNNQNRQVWGKIGYRGVHQKDGKYKVFISVGGRRIYLGRFTTAEEGALAYDVAAVLYYGEGAALNFPEVP